MKTIFSVLAVFAFSALVMAPVTPKKYPPPPVLEQRREIALQKEAINRTIDKIEYELAIDSIISTPLQDEQ
ncbi:hypothetical protein ACI6PS_02485 [Flavobacterium sp. PLA-1-15]|uniref:hypothetical protein n=1 Tax=Flavobacterium sp. PLA-1-15 TaxID=3380533 RepID=UPI003B76B212